MIGLLLCPIILAVSGIEENHPLYIFFDSICFADMNIIVYGASFISILLLCFFAISFYVNKIASKIIIKHEDVTISTPNSTKALYNLLSKKIVVDENNLELDIINFPDSEIDVLSAEKDLASITIRKYTLEGPNKTLKKIKLTSDKTYNYILKVNV